MARFLCSNFSEFRRKWGIAFLAFFWITGLFFGLRLSLDAGHIHISLMQEALHGSLSIVGLLVCVFLPLLFSAFAVYISQPALLLLICFFKAACMAFVSCGFISAFGSGAWVLWLIVLFPDLLGGAMLLVFSMRHLALDHPLRQRELLPYWISGILAAYLEYTVLGPFLTEII